MNIRRTACFAASIAALWGGLSGVAAAAQPCFPGYGWYPGLWYNVYVGESVPYFALHPPVYYSYPVPRTYGWSPFAYPPGTMTPEMEAPSAQPQVFRNPYAEQPSSAASDNVAAVKPLRIVNPYAIHDAEAVRLSQSNDEP